jgi:hypothetical protein
LYNFLNFKSKKFGTNFGGKIILYLPRQVGLDGNEKKPAKKYLSRTKLFLGENLLN